MPNQARVPRPIEALLFDVGGVLSQDRVEDKLADLARKYGVSYERLIAVKDPIRLDADLGRLSDAEFWQRTLATVGVDATEEDVDIEPYLAEVPGTLEVVRALHGRVRLGILSNDSRELSSARRRRHGFDQLFDPIIISAHIGLVKPGREIYHHALQRLGVAAERCLFVDNREDNVAAARACGLRALRFTTAARLAEDLAAFEWVAPPDDGDR
ncbi:MAG: HAD family phosphatase [Deltaproteobacteria bacterium]|jgi:putative hydrolase of the HAD superfamily|nr:HAD family phosphatase [Deltaproteobacteria bacterium]MBW2531137.1 HAD family phosphatase [Deltaproteobacteria bacterium]